MYELVPPKSGLVEYKSVYYQEDNAPIFMLKIFDFEEDQEYTSLIIKNSDKDEDGKIIINNEQYYIDLFRLGVPEIKGVEGKFTPSWKVIKEVVNKIVSINSVSELEK